MKNVVTFETARKLKDAGFPQPEAEFGQVWYRPEYIDNSNTILVTGQWDEGPYGIGDMGQQYSPYNLAWHELVFAPTATDILEYLPHSLGLRFHSDKDGAKYFYVEEIEARSILCGAADGPEVCGQEYLNQKHRAKP